MSVRVVIDSPTANRRQPLLTERMRREGEEKRGCGGKQGRIGDVAGGVAGGTAACAMVCCCCPCAVLHFIVLAVYKVPTGLFRRAWRKKKKKQMIRKKRKLMSMMMAETTGKDDYQAAATAADANYKFQSSSPSCDDDDDWDGSSGDTKDSFETEMWDRFHEGGFWRSSLDRED